MASSSNRKSNSSASSASKPTFRRAGGAAAARRTSAQSSRGAAKRTASARPGPARASQGAKRPIRSYAAPSKKTRGSNACAAQRAGGGRAIATRTARSVTPSARSAGKQQRAGAMRRTTFWAHRRADGTEGAAAPSARPVGARRTSTGSPTRGAAESGARRSRGPAGSPRRRHRGRMVLALTVSLLVIAAVGSVVIFNSGLFEATDVVVHGSAHVGERQARKLIRVPDGATLLNLNEGAIGSRILKNPWVDRVDIEREFPHRLIITPHERTVLAIVYINADDIAWAIDSDDTWIAPVTLSVRVDGEGAVVSGGAADENKGASAEGVTELTGADAATALAQQAGAVLLSGASADVKPASGAKVTSSIILAGLSYAHGFSDAFLKKIKNIELASSQSGISANLSSGVEVMLGKPTDIGTKEQVVVRMLQQRKVTYINVSDPDNATFRGAPDA